MEHRRVGWLLAASGMLLVSTDSLFVRLAEADAWDITFLVAAYSLIVQLGLHHRLDSDGPVKIMRSATGPLVAIAVLAGISQLAFITAITRTEVSNVVTIVAATPVVAALVGRVAFGERTSRRVWVAIGITAVGVAVVVSGSLGEPTLDGDVLALAAIVAFSININIWRRHRDLSRYFALAMSAAVTLTVASFFASPFSLEPRTYFACAAMGLLFNPIGRLAHSNAPRFAPPAEVALFTPVETVAATLWAWIAFSEIPAGTTVVGAAVVIGGVLYGTVSQKRVPVAQNVQQP